MINLKKYIKNIIIFVLILIFLSVLSYSVDKKRIENNEDPILCLKVKTVKDGGTREYIGLGYQIIKWNILTESSSIKTGYEIHTYLDLRDINDGPSIELIEK